jgi:hypothetical protein
MPVGLDSLTMPPTLADKLYLDGAGKTPEGIANELNRRPTSCAPRSPMALLRTGSSVMAHGSRSVTPLPLAKSSGTDA